MSPKQPTRLVLPGPVDWQPFRRGRRGEWALAGPKEKRDIDGTTWVGLPSLQFEFLFARLPEGTAAEREGMLRLEMESRGWQPDGRDQGRWASLMVEEGGHVECVAACWSGHPSADEFARAGGFGPSAWAYRYRPNAVTVWKEGGGLVAVWTGVRADFPLHCQGLSRGAADAGLAEEIQMAELALRLAGVPVRTTTIVLRGDVADDPGREGLAAALGWNWVGEEISPAEDGFQNSLGLLPAPAAAYRKRVRDQARMRGFIAFSLVVMAVGGILMVRPALATQEELRAREAVLDGIEPELSRLRSARQAWNLLQPALNPHRYPQELLLRCVQEVPAEGIRVTQFEATLNSLLLAGEASTPQLAIAFQNRLKQNVELAGVVWDAPSPGFQPDGRASFQIQATFQNVPEQP